MKYNYIFDPTSNKYVNLNTNKGYTIIKQYLNILIGKGNRSKKVYAPESYFEGLDKKERKTRLKRIKKGSKMDSRNPKAYKKFTTDYRQGKLIKTKPSKYTKQWKKLFPKANSLKDKSKVTGISLNIIKKIYNKGMAAWRTGHRPGATQQQWGYARVHSFLVKGKTFYTADKALAMKALKTKKGKKWFNNIEGICDDDDFKKQNKWCP